jgi:hypothetical protein
MNVIQYPKKMPSFRLDNDLTIVNSSNYIQTILPYRFKMAR